MTAFEDNMLTLTGAQADLLRAIAELQIIQTEKLKNIAIAMKADRKQLYLTVPDGGGTYAVGVGATTLDFERGEIITTTGEIQTMRSSLITQGVPTMRSFMLTASTAIGISLDGGGTWSLDAGERLCIGDFDFRQIYISADAVSNIKCMASTTSDMTSFYDRFFSADLTSAFGQLRDYVYDAPETASQNVLLDLGTSTRAKVEAFASATVATDFYIETSNDLVRWWTTESETGVTSFHAGFDNASRYVRLRSAAAGAAGNTVSLEIVAVR